MEHKGTVYFFTGLSGAGKTTVGSLFYQRLKNTKPNAVYLDGDEIRVAFGEDVGYTNDERLRWAGRIFRVCRLLSDQGIDVVCCSIAMYQTLSGRWNRAQYPQLQGDLSEGEAGDPAWPAQPEGALHRGAQCGGGGPAL